MDAAAPSRAGTRFGKYQIVRLLGRGGMGEVFDAVDTDKRRTVALKILLEDYSADEDYRRRFTREAHAAAQLQEPHNVHDAYWAVGPPGKSPREIGARGSRDCGQPGDNRCRGALFVMRCAVHGSDGQITCEGGYNARAFIY